MSEQPVTTNVSSDDKLWAALSYVFSPLVPIILLLMEDKKKIPFVKFHAVQSLAIGIILIVVVPILAMFTFAVAQSSGSLCSIGLTKPTRA